MIVPKLPIVLEALLFFKILALLLQNPLKMAWKFLKNEVKERVDLYDLKYYIKHQK